MERNYGEKRSFSVSASTQTTLHIRVERTNVLFNKANREKRKLTFQCGFGRTPTSLVLEFRATLLAFVPNKKAGHTPNQPRLAFSPCEKRKFSLEKERALPTGTFSALLDCQLVDNNEDSKTRLVLKLTIRERRSGCKDAKERKNTTGVLRCK